PLSTRSSVADAITTRPSAMATRSVASFADTSTMRACPLWPRWVSLPPSRPMGLLRRALKSLRPTEQGTCGLLHIGLAHQAFAYQERAHANAREIVEIGGGEDSALRHGDAVRRNTRRKAPGGRERGLEGAQVTVVDADEPRAQLEGALELGVVMHLNERVHAI